MIIIKLIIDKIVMTDREICQETTVQTRIVNYKLNVRQVCIVIKVLIHHILSNHATECSIWRPDTTNSRQAFLQAIQLLHTNRMEICVFHNGQYSQQGAGTQQCPCGLEFSVLMGIS